MVGRTARGIYPNGSQLCEPRCGQTREIYLWLAGMTGRPLYDVYLTHTAETGQHWPLGAFSKSFSCLVPHCDQTYHKSYVLTPNGPVYIWSFLW